MMMRMMKMDSSPRNTNFSQNFHKVNLGIINLTFNLVENAKNVTFSPVSVSQRRMAESRELKKNILLFSQKLILNGGRHCWPSERLCNEGTFLYQLENTSDQVDS